MITLGVNGYITVEQFQAWCNARLIEYFDYNDLQIEAAITVVSVDFIDTNYEFKGRKIDQAQLMSLPTDCVMIEDIQNATCTAVWSQLRGLLFVDESAQLQREVLSESSKLGDLSESTTYAEGTSREYTYNTRKIDQLMKPYVISGSGGLGLYRG